VFEGKEAVAVSSALLLCYSVGAIFGPVLAALTMTLLNSPYGLYVYWSAVAGVFAVMTVYLRRKERILIIAPAQQVHFAPMKNTSSVAMVLDPRTGAEEAKGK
jgi:MFS family permease